MAAGFPPVPSAMPHARLPACASPPCGVRSRQSRRPPAGTAPPSVFPACLHLDGHDLADDQIAQRLHPYGRGHRDASAGLSDHPQDRDHRGVGMLEILTVALFLLVAAGIAWTGLHKGGWRTRGVERVASPTVQAGSLLPSHARRWSDLVSRIGTTVPASARDLPRLKRRLLCAGFRDPNAAACFQGARLAGTLL